MNESPDNQIANMEEGIALPRKNGELVFDAPWEGRAFGMAVALNENGEYEWREFQTMLAAEIADAEQSNDPSTYYERWLASLEKLLLDKGMLEAKELEIRTTGYASGERDDDWYD
jgi:nitrile hydratase accessory protein